MHAAAAASCCCGCLYSCSAGCSDAAAARDMVPLQQQPCCSHSGVQTPEQLDFNIGIFSLLQAGRCLPLVSPSPAAAAFGLAAASSALSTPAVAAAGPLPPHQYIPYHDVISYYCCCCCCCCGLVCLCCCVSRSCLFRALLSCWSCL